MMLLPSCFARSLPIFAYCFYLPVHTVDRIVLRGLCGVSVLLQMTNVMFGGGIARPTLLLFDSFSARAHPLFNDVI